MSNRGGRCRRGALGSCCPPERSADNADYRLGDGRRRFSPIGAVLYPPSRTSPDQLRDDFPCVVVGMLLKVVSALYRTRIPRRTMRFDLNEEETAALRKLLADAIEYDRYPLSPRVQTLKRILSKFLPKAPPLPLAKPPAPEPSRTPRSRSRRVR